MCEDSVSQIRAGMAGWQHVLWTHAEFSSRRFLEWLERDFRLSDYDLSRARRANSSDFRGTWAETTMWELYSLAILDELKTRAQSENAERVRPRYSLRPGEN